MEDGETTEEPNRSEEDEEEEETTPADDAEGAEDSEEEREQDEEEDPQRQSPQSNHGFLAPQLSSEEGVFDSDVLGVSDPLRTGFYCKSDSSPEFGLN